MRFMTVAAASVIAASGILAGCRGGAQAAGTTEKTKNEMVPMTPAASSGDINLPDTRALQPETSSAKKPARKAVRVKPVPTATLSALELAPAEPEIAPVLESRPVVARHEEPQEELTTLVGCLTRDGDDSFRLKDASGENAPRTRSWKSGFIRKRTAKVDIVDPAARLNLSPHVGYRVSVTGPLVEREMHLRSVQPTSKRCE